MEIKNYNPITNQPGTCIAVSRAAVAIYLALCDAGVQDGKVLVPANLCYAGIFPAVYAGLNVKFCDVNPKTGNVTFSTVEKALDESVKAAIIPHMYGNPIPDLPEICNLLRKKKILIIEDCASAMGATAENYVVGGQGDYVVYSTGKAKTVDLGYGGLLFSAKSDLSIAKSIKASLPLCEDLTSANLQLFSKLYRLLRNDGNGCSIADNIYINLVNWCKDDFLFQLPAEVEDEVFSVTERLEDIIEIRRKQCLIYKDNIKVDFADTFDYNEGAVPWRYNIFVDEHVRADFISFCLDNHLPVSDWYPNITQFFGKRQNLSGVDWHEKHILNFPLPSSEAEIIKICDLINSYFLNINLE